MWLKFEKNTSKFYLRERMEEPLEISDNGTAQVSKELGEYILEHYQGVKEKEPKEMNEGDPEFIAGNEEVNDG